EAARQLLPTVLTVTIIGLVESIGIAKVLEAKHRGEYRVDADKEFRALGVSKIVGSFFQSMPTSASFTRSAVNDDSGARTPVASLVTALLIALTLLFFTPLFFYLPEAILAAIILVAVGSLFEFQEARRLWEVHRHDFYMLVLTFAITLFAGIVTGVFAGVVLSILLVLWRHSKPHVAVLGQLPDTPIYRNVSRFPEAVEHPGTLVLRFDAPLYFGNAQYFKDSIKDFVQARQGELDFLLLDASSISEMDSSGLHALEDVHQFLRAQNIRFAVSGLIGPVRDLLARSGMMEKLGHENIFLTIQQGIDAFHHSGSHPSERLRQAAVQANDPKKKKP
ncbi:MAG: STAS domain-containing protein, partial [Bacteroidetes bacterium]